MLIGVSVGILGAVRRYSVFDYLATTWAMLALSLPTFWFGLVAIYIFAVELGWFPAGGFVPLNGAGRRRATRSGISSCPQACWRWCWSRNGAATPGRRCSTSSITTSCGPRAPRVCRVPRVLFGHGLRAALVPLITLLGLQIPLLLGGALVTETVFSWPGMGLLFVNSLSMRDYPVLMAILMLSSVTVVLGNLAADLLNAWMDPRIRLEGARR